jgi:3-dehydrosphinganine reductase
VLDVSDRDAVTATLRRHRRRPRLGRHPRVQRGHRPPGYFEELDDEVFREMMEVDYFGTLWPIREVVPA